MGNRDLYGILAAASVAVLLFVYFFFVQNTHASEEATCSPTMILTAIPTVTQSPTMAPSPTAGTSAVIVTPTGQMPLLPPAAGRGL